MMGYSEPSEQLKYSNSGDKLDLNIEAFSGMMPTTSTLPLRGSGRGGIERRLFRESARKDRSFSILLGRGSFGLLNSFARLASEVISSAWRPRSSFRSLPFSDYKAKPKNMLKSHMETLPLAIALRI